MWQSQVENEHYNYSVGAVALKFSVHVYSSIIHEETQKIWSEFILEIEPIKLAWNNVHFLPVTATYIGALHYMKLN